MADYRSPLSHSENCWRSSRDRRILQDFFLQVLLIGDAFCRFICGPSKGLNFTTKVWNISQNRNKLGVPGISTRYAWQAGRITFTKPLASSFSVNSGSMIWDVGLNSFANLNLLKFCSKSHIALRVKCPDTVVISCKLVPLVLPNLGFMLNPSLCSDLSWLQTCASGPSKSWFMVWSLYMWIR